MDHSPESLNAFSAEQQKKSPEPEVYTPRPASHRLAAWLLIAVVLFAFAGTCYWLATYGRG